MFFTISPRGKRTYSHAVGRAEAFKSKRDLSCSISEAQNKTKQKKKENKLPLHRCQVSSCKTEIHPEKQHSQSGETNPRALWKIPLASWHQGHCLQLSLCVARKPEKVERWLGVGEGGPTWQSCPAKSPAGCVVDRELNGRAPPTTTSSKVRDEVWGSFYLWSLFICLFLNLLSNPLQWLPLCVVVVVTVVFKCGLL